MHIHVDTWTFINAHVLVMPYIVCVLYMCACMYSLYASFQFVPWLGMTSGMGILSFLVEILQPSYRFMLALFLSGAYGDSDGQEQKGECQPRDSWWTIRWFRAVYGLTCLKSGLFCVTLWPRYFLVSRLTFHSCQIRKYSTYVQWTTDADDYCWQRNDEVLSAAQNNVHHPNPNHRNSKADLNKFDQTVIFSSLVKLELGCLSTMLSA